MVDQIYKCRDTVSVDGVDRPCRRTKIRVNGFRWVCPPECPNCEMGEVECRLYSASATPLFPNRQNSVERDYPPHSTALADCHCGPPRASARAFYIQKRT